ncbi:hypothetical protein SIFV0011 [Sulfolobus islandicus filamentous virus]|uniref:Uncharacterized protein 11 n=1 Tax=Sulfolobus islandicus filamentous virus (isolate Iceland/Hveragerdi) TaxID=654908 RepID=Y011_SIFVH|nr:hypothetical protein SIFV0011 [Sulfolobus islandicus filamentous virus]Q914L9.1 RecName: Full=Uncharacterized protein 11 [Sulfolobus islandicus filamentous virus (isolate Hveragerdi)]AAL27722.1 hypothetical protein [Sulfolobus islandicus filamentous virus]
MVSSKDKIKEELKQEEPEENVEIANTETQKIEMVEEAKSDEFVLPFQRENLKNYLWRLLIIKKVEIRDVILKNSNEPAQVSYIDGYVIDNNELEQRLIKEIVNNQTIPINLLKEVNNHKKEVYLFSTSQGVYYSLLRSVVPKLKNGAVIVGIALQQSDYPQPMVTLVHPSRLEELKTQYEALSKTKKG